MGRRLLVGDKSEDLPLANYSEFPWGWELKKNLFYYFLGMKHLRLIVINAFIHLWWIVPLHVDAQNADTKKVITDSIYNLKEVRVHGRRPLATAQTLQGADLKALSTTTVADALKYFAGVQIKDYGGLGGLKTINVRSLGAQHVGVYIDGIRITNAQNGTVDLGKYSLSSMESVALYNANKLDNCQSASEYASGATVYLRTRRPVSDSLSLQLRRSSFSTYTVKANAQFKKKGWSGFVDGEYCDSKGDYPFRYKIGRAHV